jgi:superfamily II DNA/RNA helicase
MCAQIEEVLSAIPTDKPRQTLLFSATIPDWVKKVHQLYCSSFRCDELDQVAKKYLKPDHKVIDLVSSHKEKTPKKVSCSFLSASSA